MLEFNVERRLKRLRLPQSRRSPEKSQNSFSPSRVLQKRYSIEREALEKRSYSSTRQSGPLRSSVYKLPTLTHHNEQPTLSQIQSPKAISNKLHFQESNFKYKDIEMSPEQFKLAYTRSRVIDSLKSDKIYKLDQLKALMKDCSDEAEGLVEVERKEYSGKKVREDRSRREFLSKSPYNSPSISFSFLPKRSKARLRPILEKVLKSQSRLNELLTPTSLSRSPQHREGRARGTNISDC